MIHLAHFEFENKARWGIVDGERFFLIEEMYQNTAAVLAAKDELIELASRNLSSLKSVHASDVTLLSPVNGMKRVICQGANYRQHMIESGMDPDAKNFNMFFNKSTASVCVSNSDILKPSHVSLLDYEIELGLVIAKGIYSQTEVTAENLSEYIGALIITNDVSARDVQIPETQFFKGKSYRTFCPVGPYLCLLDKNSIHYIDELNLELKVNGIVRQKDSTANLVFKPAETLTELSGFSDLDPGDLILTGTPSGCALRIPPPFIVGLFSLLPEATRWKMFKRIQGKRSDYLQHGDLVEARIYSEDEKVDLGQQRNLVNHQ